MVQDICAYMSAIHTHYIKHTTHTHLWYTQYVCQKEHDVCIYIYIICKAQLHPEHS